MLLIFKHRKTHLLEAKKFGGHRARNQRRSEARAKKKKEKEHKEKEKEQKEKEKERVRRWYEEVGQPKRVKERAARKIKQLSLWVEKQEELEGVEAVDKFFDATLLP